MTDTIAVSFKQLAKMVLDDEYPGEDNRVWYSNVLNSLVNYAHANPEDPYGACRESVTMFWNMHKTLCTRVATEVDPKTSLNLGDFVEVFVSTNKVFKLAQSDNVSASFVKALRKRFMECLKQNSIPESQWSTLLELCFNMEKMITPLTDKLVQKEDAPKTVPKEEATLATFQFPPPPPVPKESPAKGFDLNEFINTLRTPSDSKAATGTDLLSTVSQILTSLSVPSESSGDKSGENDFAKQVQSHVTSILTKMKESANKVPAETGTKDSDKPKECACGDSKSPSTCEKKEDWETRFREDYTKLKQKMRKESVSDAYIQEVFAKLKPKDASAFDLIKFATDAWKIMAEVDKQYSSNGQKTGKHIATYKCGDCDKYHTCEMNVTRLFPLGDEPARNEIVESLKDVLKGYRISRVRQAHLNGSVKPNANESVDKDYSETRQFTDVATLQRMATKKDPRFSGFTPARFSSFLEEAGCCLLVDSGGDVVANLVPANVRYASEYSL